LKPSKGQLILDAGCGVGGASLWLAKSTAANYVGITVSDVQLRMANEFARRRDLLGRVKFFKKNYFKSSFENEKFDHIFGLESFCYAYPDPQFLYEEMYRILKPGGKLLISDGILLRQPKDEYERGITSDFCRGFKMVGWNTPAEIIRYLKEVGFKNVQFIDKTREIAPSVADIWKRSRIVSIFRILKYFGLVSQTEVEILLATRSQKLMYECKLFGYGVFVAQKPPAK
jgi:cyclopropane fatty-acyl-phospholipid synthase-like methyltransferase